MLDRIARSLALGAASALAAGTALATDITGAGATFPYPVLSQWSTDYSAMAGVKVNYQSIGSGGGIAQIKAGTVDFGASDKPLAPDELAQFGLAQFPIVIGGVVPVVNIEGVAPGQLKLTGPVLADIYLGKITKWNDPAITALNPSTKLPDTAIAVVRRADGSGTSFNFTNYLSKVNAEWKSKVGEGTTVNWPVGTGGKGNEGVSAFVQRIPGAIGYVEYAYAKQSKMPYASMQNASGNYVLPDDSTFQAAAAGADWEKSQYYVILTNQAGKDAWPIAASTFIIMHKTQDKPAQGAEVLKFFDWSYKNGAKMAEDLDYVPLPSALVASIKKTWSSELKDASGKSIAQ